VSLMRECDGKSDDNDSAYDIVGDDCIDGLGNAWPRNICVDQAFLIFTLPIPSLIYSHRGYPSC
jgi:hypothetical protein